jgi:aspartate/methionine/tyrosine aminotransferase
MLTKYIFVHVCESGFGQEDGTYHLRLTFLPEEDKLLAASESIKEHHVWFSQQHADDA